MQYLFVIFIGAMIGIAMNQPAPPIYYRTIQSTPSTDSGHSPCVAAISGPGFGMVYEDKSCVARREALMKARGNN